LHTALQRGKPRTRQIERKVIYVEGATDIALGCVHAPHRGHDVIEREGKTNHTEDAALRDPFLLKKSSGVGSTDSHPKGAVFEEVPNEEGEVTAKAQGVEFEKNPTPPGVVVSLFEVEEDTKDHVAQSECTADIVIKSQQRLGRGAVAAKAMLMRRERRGVLQAVHEAARHHPLQDLPHTAREVDQTVAIREKGILTRFGERHGVRHPPEGGKGVGGPYMLVNVQKKRRGGRV
jgi:hypothetical protein